VAPDELKIAVWQSLKDTLDHYHGIHEEEVGAAVFESRQHYSS